MIYDTKRITQELDNYDKGGKMPDIYYRKKVGLRKHSIVFKHTDSEITEYHKCSKDIVYFAENYCKILDKNTGELLNVKLRDYQIDLLKSISANRFNIIANSRQTGISLIQTILILHRFIFSMDRNIEIIDCNLDSAKNKLDSVRNMYIHLPFFMKHGITKSNSIMFNSESGNRIRAKAATKNMTLGYQIHELYVDNFARISPKSLENMYHTIFPCLAAIKNSRIYISSSPNGYNLFTRILDEAENGQNSYKAHRVYWWQVPGRDEAWKEKEIKKLGSQELFDQEYELKFKSKNKGEN